ncbi:MAG: hypothetical protein NT007_06375 [Candidatus Kapabacteria bacterium]|nr:hypothetical protein [Candidatus Kapabacteria bacterium]
MKTRNNHVSVIPANAGIPFHGAIGDSCIHRNDSLQVGNDIICIKPLFLK